MLEASMYEENAFLTLTYNEENMPADGNLNPVHLKNYFKRLRKTIEPLRLRYFAVGEYGEQSEHPHYHAIIFGLSACRRGISSYTRYRDVCCDICSLHSKAWGHGNVFVGQVTPQSAAYVCGYVVKKLKRKGGVEDTGKVAEFARMSNRPGIGAGIADEIASTILQHNLEDSLEDVPLVLRHGKKILPLGRYIRRRIRERIGRSPNAPQEVLDKMAAELQPLREASFASAPSGQKENAFRGALADQQEGKRKQLEGKERLYRKKGSI